jgi:hypothetical protein
MTTAWFILEFSSRDFKKTNKARSPSARQGALASITPVGTPAPLCQSDLGRRRTTFLFFFCF